MTGPIRPSIGLPPTETLEFFRAKGEYPVSRKWWEVWQEEHARAFTVAGITDRTVLERVRASLDVAASEGGTLANWKKNVLPELRAAVEAGSAPETVLTARRLRTIYDTNLRMARAAGKWKRIQATKHVAPFLMYSAVLDDRTRPLHRAWHGTILPVDHPWWDTHFPPCGWMCRCNVVQLSQADIDVRGLTVASTPPNDGPPRTFIRGDGVIESVPTGIDPGFAYNVGKAHMRGLVPPPRSGPIDEPHLLGGAAQEDLPAMPPPRPMSAALKMDAAAPYQEVADAFIDSFGKRNSAGAVNFVDAVGQPLTIDSSFFFRGGVDNGPDTRKLVQTIRRQHIRYLAEALKAPDEIWYVWERTKTHWRLTRRYVARFEIDGELRPMVVVMSIGADGWKGVTAFTARNPDYVDNNSVRGGVLVYRRK